MTIRTGVDLIEIERVAEALERHGARFLSRVFTPTEIQEAAGRPASLAARFAAKEAASKALGCGIGPIGWQEIEIVHDAQHAPILRLSGAAAALAAQAGLHEFSVSLSHNHTSAIAVVVLSSA